MKPNENEKIAAKKCSKFLADKRTAMAQIAKGGSIDELKNKGVKIALPI